MANQAKTFEVICRAENGNFWLSGPIAGRALDAEINYMHGLYPVSEVTYLPTATARQMAKAGRLLDWRNTGILKIRDAARVRA